MKRSFIVRGAMVSIVFMTMAGCAALPGRGEHRVQKVAEARWDALIKGDFEKAYSYTTQGFQRVVNKRQYSQRFSNAVTWLAASAVQAHCPENDKCLVKVKLTYKPNINARVGAADIFFDETWIREGGEWRLVHDL